MAVLVVRAPNHGAVRQCRSYSAIRSGLTDGGAGGSGQGRSDSCSEVHKLRPGWRASRTGDRSAGAAASPEGNVARSSAKGALMQELRLVAVSEDGSYAVLVVPGRSGRYALPIDERLRTVARGQFSRLAQYEIEVESPLRPKEIQDRIRAGETAEEIADAAGLPVERIRRFEGRSWPSASSGQPRRSGQRSGALVRPGSGRGSARSSASGSRSSAAVPRIRNGTPESEPMATGRYSSPIRWPAGCT